MTWWTTAGQYVIEAFAVALILRVLWLRDRKETVYLLFSAFLMQHLTEAVAYFAYVRWGRHLFDYRLMWIGFKTTWALLALWLAYALAKAVLAELPGILRFSRIVLNIVFPLAVIIAVWTARGEYTISHVTKSRPLLARVTAVFRVADGAVSTTSVIVLLAILAFILWFPVKMSKNLAIFSVGFVVYFASEAGIELLRSYSIGVSDYLDIAESVILVLCFLYWLVFLHPEGQTIHVQMGHSWRLAEQKRLVEQLESLNTALLRSSQRMQL